MVVQLYYYYSHASVDTPGAVTQFGEIQMFSSCLDITCSMLFLWPFEYISIKHVKTLYAKVPLLLQHLRWRIIIRRLNGLKPRQKSYQHLTINKTVVSRVFSQRDMKIFFSTDGVVHLELLSGVLCLCNNKKEKHSRFLCL